MLDAAAISVVLPSFRRPGRLSSMLTRLAACDPPPGEIIVHVDGGDEETAGLLATAHPHVHVLRSALRVGPGGGRTRAIEAARGTWVASFDDDSWPVETSFFGRAAALLSGATDVAVVGCAVVHPGEPLPPGGAGTEPAATFTGCGALYLRRAFRSLGGFVPLPRAYGMEEADLALRLTAAGWKIRRAPGLLVLHDTDRSHHAEPSLNAASISNLALLAFLRYPPPCWPLGACQVLGRLAWLARAGRFRGMARGLGEIPARLWRYRHYRAPVSVGSLRAHRALLREHG